MSAIVRFMTPDSDPVAGRLTGNGVVEGPDGKQWPVAEIRFLPPCTPTKVVCVGLNYADHAEELQMDVPEEPILFFKPPSSVVGHLADVVNPPEATRLDYEAELAVVIGEPGRRIRRADALDHIAGYTLFNDITARNFQTPGSQWTRAKGFDTFGPLGPALVSDLDPSSLPIECRVNGEIRQQSNTNQMIFDVPDLVAFVSSIMTLEAGDVIATGTPPGVGTIDIGDVVEVTVEGIGTLRNKVVGESAGGKT